MVHHFKELTEKIGLILKLLLSVVITIVVLGMVAPKMPDFLASYVSPDVVVGKKMIQETLFTTFIIVGLVFCGLLFYIFKLLSLIEKKSLSLREKIDRLLELSLSQEELRLQYNDLSKRGHKELSECREGFVDHLSQCHQKLDQLGRERYFLYETIVEMDTLLHDVSSFSTSLQRTLKEKEFPQKYEEQIERLQILSENIFRIQLHVLNAAVDSGKDQGNHSAVSLISRDIEQLIHESNISITDFQNYLENEKSDFISYKEHWAPHLESLLGISAKLGALFNKLFTSLENIQTLSFQISTDLNPERWSQFEGILTIHQEKMEKIVEQVLRKTEMAQEELGTLLTFSQNANWTESLFTPLDNSHNNNDDDEDQDELDEIRAENQKAITSISQESILVGLLGITASVGAGHATQAFLQE